MRCPDCGNEWARTVGKWDYAADVGLSPDEYTCVLDDVELFRCECGETAAISAMEELHASIAIQLLTHPDPLKASGIRYLRRYFDRRLHFS